MRIAPYEVIVGIAARHLSCVTNMDSHFSHLKTVCTKAERISSTLLIERVTFHAREAVDKCKMEQPWLDNLVFLH